MGAVTLVVGGQKSGKSSTAARLATSSGRPVVVVAPADAADEEMRERIERHRRDRPADWATVETFEAADAVRRASPEACVVIDALDTWLSHAMGAHGLWVDDEVAALGEAGSAAAERLLAQVDDLVRACLDRPGPVVVVAGQPGLGLHPMNANGRRYVDLHGLALRRIGAHAQVVQTVAGRAQVVARSPGTAPAAVPIDALAAAGRVRPADAAARQAARDRHDGLAKPPGSLGGLEDPAVRLAGVAGRCPPPVPSRPALLLAAADHGVHAEGVTPWPQEVTAAIVRAACAGGAVSRALADASGVRMVVLDVGVVGDVPDHPALLRRRVRAGTANLHVGDAMDPAEAVAAMDEGAGVAAALVAEGADVLLLGDMGLANTTASACLVGAFTGAPAEAVTGRGAGADEATLVRKTEVVRRALARLSGDAGPVDVLAAVGGLEHAALAGAMLAAAERRVPVLLDGVITQAAALVAAALCPAVTDFLVAGHRSAEPASALALTHLGLEPLLDLGLRLGEGSGALVAWPVLRAAAVALRDTALLQSL